MSSKLDTITKEMQGLKERVEEMEVHVGQVEDMTTWHHNAGLELQGRGLCVEVPPARDEGNPAVTRLGERKDQSLRKVGATVADRAKEKLQGYQRSPTEWTGKLALRVATHCICKVPLVLTLWSWGRLQGPYWERWTLRMVLVSLLNTFIGPFLHDRLYPRPTSTGSWRRRVISSSFGVSGIFCFLCFVFCFILSEVLLVVLFILCSQGLFISFIL